MGERYGWEDGGQRGGAEREAAEAAASRGRQAASEHSLDDAGYVVDQDVALAHEGDQREPDGFRLTDDHALDVGEDALGDDPGFFHGSLLNAADRPVDYSRRE